MSKSKSGSKKGSVEIKKESSEGSFRTATGEHSKKSGSNSEVAPRYPRHIEKPILAARLLQKEYGSLETSYYSECINLKKQYLEKFKAVWAKRANLVAGETECKSEDCVMSDAEDGTKRNIQARENVKYPDDCKGLPGFWFDVMSWHDPTAQLIQKHDADILKCLKDISYSLIDAHDESAGFTLEFHFGENEHFKEHTLTKTYYQSPSPDANDPMIYEDPVPSHVQSTAINWTSKNPMVKKIEKEYVNKKTGNRKKMTKEEPQASFFQLFTSVAPRDRDPKKSEDDEFDKHMEVLTLDFELGQFFKERLIPRAILYFTGENVDYEEEGFDQNEGDYSDMSGSGSGRSGSEDESGSEGGSAPSFSGSFPDMKKMKGKRGKGRK